MIPMTNAMTILTETIFRNNLAYKFSSERLGMNLITGYSERVRNILKLDGTTIYVTPSPYVDGVIEVAVNSKYSLNLVSFFNNHTSTVPTHILLNTYPVDIRHTVSEYRYNSNVFALHLTHMDEFELFVIDLINELSVFTPQYIEGNADGKC